MRRFWAVPVVILLMAVSLAMLGGDDPRSLGAKFSSPSEIFEYRSLASYSEAPSLAKLVAEGKLPPVKERLPEEPFVWKTSFMLDGIGVYGDLMRHSRGSEPECWQNMMGCYSAWEGGEGHKNEGLVDVALMWVMKSPEPVPNLAKSWEWSSDGYTLTMHLMKGVKWSDGVEFTADDILFTYNDLILDPKVPSMQNADSWTFGGKVTELEKVDAYTIRWHFGAAFPVRALFLMDGKYYAPIPAHVYKSYHPKYNPSMTYDDLLASPKTSNVPAVVIGPFVPVHYEPASVTVYVRNPYYYKVDEKGQQLPYLDAAVWIQDPDWSMRNYRTLTGEIDQAPLQDVQLTRLIYAASLDAKAPFVFQWGPFTQPFAIFLNYSTNVGIRDVRDTALREMFRKLEFREALAYAIDGQGIAEGVFGTPDVQAFYGGYPSGSPLYREQDVTKYVYNPTRAKELLAGLGFKDTNGDGILNWPAGSALAGQELTIELFTAATNPDHIALAEASLPFLKAVGIDMQLRTIGETMLQEKEDLQEFDAILEPTYSTTPDSRPESIGPISPSTPWWHKAAADGTRDLMPFEQRMGDLLVSTFTMPDAAKRADAFHEVLALTTANVYAIPLVEVAYSMTYTKRHMGYPSDLPIFLYDWFHENIPVELIWAPAEKQLPTEQYLQYLPTPETYKAQTWYKVYGG